MENRHAGRTRKTEAYQAALKQAPALYRAAQAMRSSSFHTLESSAAWVWGPALGAFVRWLVTQAVQNGVRRLYFLSRDGYFPCLAARIFCRAFHLPLECRYLACSRFSLRQPLYHLDHDQALDHLCRWGLQVTPLRILRRAGLSPEECAAIWPKLGLSFAPDEPTSRASLAQIRKALAENHDFLEMLDRHSREALPALTGYFKQEGLLDDIPYAFADSGWTGTTLESLHQVLSQMGCQKLPDGYFWGLYELPKEVPAACVHTYFFAPNKGLREKIDFNPCVFEAVLSAPHGMTIGYKKSGDRWIPRLAPALPDRVTFCCRMRQPLLTYIHLLAQDTDLPPDLIRERKAVSQVLRLFMSTPSRQEARVFGSLPFSDDVLGEETEPLARPLTQHELRQNRTAARLHTHLRRDVPLTESAWFAASAVLSAPHPARFLRQNRRWQTLRHTRHALRRPLRRTKPKKSEDSTLRQYGFVIRQLTAREIKRRYARSYLGVFWSVLNPLLSMVVLSLIFSQLFRRSIENYPVYYLSGYLLWQMFTGTTTAAMTSLADNKSLLARVRFPVELFILTRAYTALINLVYSLPAYVLIVLFFQRRLPLSSLTAIWIIGCLFLFSLGFSYMLAAGYVFFGDLKHLYSVVLTLWMYCSAIFYPADQLGGIIRQFIEVNPLYLFIRCLRTAVSAGALPSAADFGLMLLWGLGVYAAGYAVFLKNKNRIMQKV